MAQKLKKTDVVVVGLGATGGMVSLGLARQGVEVIALEAGPERGVKDFPSDEIANDIRNNLGQVKFMRELPTFRPDAKTPATPATGGIPMMNGVGGSTTHYTAQSWRYLPWNFKMRSETIKRYGASMLPAGNLVADWPIGYEDLEPYYDKVEYELGVSGKAGNIKGKISSQGNVFEGPRQREYPLPPLRWSGWTQMAYDGADKLDWKPFRGPAAIHSQAYNGNPGCLYCGFCTYNGCHINAKASVFLNAIPDARKTGNLEVVTGARVVEINTDGDGRASGVTYVQSGVEYFQPASAVVVGTYVYENVRLLLLSKSKAFPNGLSNNHGQVGKGYIAHGYPSAGALFEGQRLNRWGGPGAQFTATDAWDADNFDHAHLGFIGGASLQAGPENKPISSARSTPPTGPQWGSEWKSWLRKHANSVGGASGQMEILAYEDNYLDLDPTHKDAWGRPVIRMTFSTKEQEERRAAFIIEKCQEWLKAMGATQTWANPFGAPALNSHAYGGTRMGNDPDTSVVDGHSVSHEVPNLVVLGGSTFLNSTGRNPTETMQALSLRAADHLVANWKSVTA